MKYESPWWRQLVRQAKRHPAYWIEGVRLWWALVVRRER